ncbi:MAG: hypothetical protein LAO79_12850 [Acidobacteriia bacterium]|nr:hypothetical protein [Terriglobia bacterium]
MKYAFLALLLLGFSVFAEKKPLSGQAGNDDIELVGSVLIDPAEMSQALGGDLSKGYVMVRIKATPKTDKPLRIGPDDFTIISRKDGQRSGALEPGQIAGRGALVVKASPNQPGGEGTMTNGPIWGGIAGISRGTSAGNTAGADGGVEAKVDNESKGKDNPLLGILKAKQLPDKETQEPIEGLLYFAIDGKIKPKDLAVIYKGPAGKLVMEFANPK